MNEFTLWNEHHDFKDFSFFYETENYDTIDSSYKWIQTSFFMASKDILNNIDSILQDLICYNMRVMGCKLNYSDEFYINYLNKYHSELFHIDFYSDQGYNENNFDTFFMYQKTKNTRNKLKMKFGNLNYNFRMHIINNKSDNEYEETINKFFIKHIKNTLW